MLVVAGAVILFVVRFVSWVYTDNEGGSAEGRE